MKIREFFFQKLGNDYFIIYGLVDTNNIALFDDFIGKTIEN